MTNKEIMEIAVAQSAIDSNCRAEDLLTDGITVVVSADNDGARKYLELPFICDLVWYGHGVVASVSPGLERPVELYMKIRGERPEHLFETPALYELNVMLKRYDARVCYMAEYFLPDVNILRPLDCGFDMRVLYPEDFAELYLPEWSNALCEKRKQLDVLGVGAYDSEEKLIGLAGCSADCDSMWQIGVDVLPEHRGCGIASAITSRLALEVLERGKVPFYCAAWSNVRSVRNALRSGFRPAWVQMTAKSDKFIDGLLDAITEELP